MSLIRRMVYSAFSKTGFGIFNSEYFTSEEVLILKSISKKQVKGWENSEIIPLQVLLVLWSWGIRFQKIEPWGGIRLKVFMSKLQEFIKHGKADLIDKELAQYIYDNIMDFEIKTQVKKYYITPKKSVIAV